MNRAHSALGSDCDSMLKPQPGMISRLLGELPCRVLTADDAESAMRLIQADPPDLIITDIRLPGNDGLELTEQTKARHPQMPVLLISAYGEPRMHMGDGFIAKPFDNDELLAWVRRYLGLQAGSLNHHAGAWPLSIWFGDRVS